METIIIQDTDIAILDILTLALEIENFQVYAIMEPEHDFLDLIAKARPHVVMLDFKINGAAALSILNKIKEKHPYLPVIAISCNHNIHGIAIQAGFDDYIAKPFDLNLLYKIIRKHIKELGY
ncbi:response regulator [Pedobacter frigiditerrae]|uniref:Response regulator n=1 Tax=Pedobacter frigiditerrae TaxID=2530452 RepID=A0A4R0MMX0_9SPHI|nr:response regulator [Pedobacter frigiditerrae]TCC88075.1 response regulator [Pedobacter frigiditerrae]